MTLESSMVIVGGEIKALGDGRVGGYLVRFTTPDAPDLEGDFFTTETDFDITAGDRVTVYYNHGLDPTMKKRKLGNASVSIDGVGVWIDAQLEMRDEYERAIYTLVGAGKLGWSSGTLPNLVERVPVKSAFWVKSWPLGKDASLTPTPAAGPEFTRVTTLKSVVALAETDDAFKALLPQESQETLDADANETAEEAADNVNFEHVEDTDMSEEIKAAPEAQAIDYDMLAEKLAAKMAPPIKTAGHVVVTEDEADKATKRNPWKSYGEFLMAVKQAADGVVDDRLRSIRSKDQADEGGFSVAKAMGDDFVGSIPAAANGIKSFKAAPTGLGESLPQFGGVLVGSDRQTSILSRVYESGQLLSRVAMDTVGANSNGMTYYAESETSRATGSRRGGIRFYWVAENSAVTASRPAFREMDLKLKKAAAAVYVTEEQLQDTSALESYIMRVLPEEIRWGVEDAILNGDGVGKPLGIENSGAVISVAKEVGQAADTVIAENVIGMWGRLWAPSKQRALWLISQDVETQLIQMSIAVGVGGALVYMPPGGLSGAPYGSLFGRPVIVHESADNVGDVGDIQLIDPTQYQMIEKGGIQSASSIHVRFLEGESVYRFIYRVDGEPMWDSPLTPANGGNTVSPFVNLAERA